MKKFIVFKRFGSAHDSIIDEVMGETAKIAFKNAVKKYFNESLYEKYTAFYVKSFDETIDIIDRTYGYDVDGQRNTTGILLSSKWIIDNILYGD